MLAFTCSIQTMDRASWVMLVIKNLSVCQCRRYKTPVRSLGGEDSLKEDMTTHASILAWRISWQRSLAGYSSWGCKDLNTN